MIDSQRGAFSIIPYDPTSTCGIIVLLIENNQILLDHNNFSLQRQEDVSIDTISRAWDSD